jgi:hypothetical protein
MATTVGIQVLSDLHLETGCYDAFKITPQTPILALIGDIGCIKDKGLFDFLRAQLDKFRLVFFLLGNHEPYGKDWDHAKTRLQNFSSEVQQLRTNADALGEFVFLDQTRHDVSDQVTVFGCTLFSNIGPTKEEVSAVSNGLNDFRHIEDWTIEQHNEAHLADLAWLNAQVKAIAEEEPHRSVVILTHYSPTYDLRTVDPAHRQNNRLRSGFSTDLSNEPCWMNESVKVWAFGRTHFNCDFQSPGGNMRVVTNQRGYSFMQANGWDDGKVIEI